MSEDASTRVVYLQWKCYLKESKTTGNQIFDLFNSSILVVFMFIWFDLIFFLLV